MKQRAGAHEEAVGQVLSFLIGGVLLMSFIGTALVATSGIGAHESGTSIEIQSTTMAKMLVDSAGIGWDAHSGHVMRLGFAQADGRSLDVTSLDALRGANLAADPTNGVVDYEEAKASLDMEAWDFRVTVAPIGLADELAAMDLSGIRTAYIGSWASAPSALVVDDAHRVQAARVSVDATMAGVAATERQALVALGLGFDNEVELGSLALDVHVDGSPKKHITETSTPESLYGDVFPDQKQYLVGMLPTRLAHYDLLVVGSGVQHPALTSDEVKNAIRDWVVDGGTLLVLGSDSQSTQWLQPLFHVGTTNVNGGAYAPHTTHPMLREPHELSWQEYGTPAKAWDIRDQGAQAHEDDFDHVIMASDGDLLAVSRPGAFETGTIMLTSYQPGNLPAGLGLSQTQAFLHNMIVFMDRSHLYLEYGAMPPHGVEIGSAVRHNLLHDDALGLVPVRIHVLVWRTG